MSALDDAELLLSRLASVQLASVTEEGYPLAREMELRDHDGIRSFSFFTKRNSNKARQFAANSKAGVSFCAGDDCVSLVGDVAVAEGDGLKPGFCLLRFISVEGTAFLDGQFTELRFLKSDA